MASTRLIDNYDMYEQYERQKERDEAHNEQISEISHVLDEAMSLCEDYDTEDNADLCNRLEKIYEILDKQSIKL